MQNTQIATFGGGCFWCTEALFNQIKGIESITPGYAGGNVPGPPTYKEVCSGLTGHAEVVQISFDTNIISYYDVLLIFMSTHNPTTLNKQGGDIGTQYRSVIFYHNEQQKDISKKIIVDTQQYYDDVIVTEINELPRFYKAEDYHHNYYANNTEQGYCNYVITPKLGKLRKQFADKLK